MRLTDKRDTSPTAGADTSGGWGGAVDKQNDARILGFCWGKLKLETLHEQISRRNKPIATPIKTVVQRLISVCAKSIRVRYSRAARGIGHRVGA